MNGHKRICWITATYMLQVDLPILKYLKNYFDIDWYVSGNSQSSIRTATEYARENNINLKLISPRHHTYNPLSYKDYCKFLKSIRKENYDLYYFDISTFPYLLFAIKRYIPRGKAVIAMHHGKIHQGMRLKTLYRPFLKYLGRQNLYFQYFSETQRKYHSGNDTSRVFTIPLAINDYGEGHPRNNTDKVRFLIFGNIIPTKNVELAIKAANMLYEEIGNKFVLDIVGHCRSWDEIYAPLIQHKEAFNLDIRRVDDDEIPALFSSADYLVLPYKAVTQSGPLRIAYGYNLPVIASDLEGFKESIVENITGIFFHNEDPVSLKDTMKKVVETYPLSYEKIKSSQKEYVQKNLSIDSVCADYLTMLNQILKNNEDNR